MPLTDPAITADGVTYALRRAGVTEMLLRESRCRPAEYRVCWPAFQAEWSDYAPDDVQLPRPLPTAADITHHDLVRRQISAGLPCRADTQRRRVLGWRMLTWWAGHALDGDPVLAWPEIARRVGSDARTAETLWDTGIHRLAAYLDRQTRNAATRAHLRVAWAFRAPTEGLCHALDRAAAPVSAPVIDGIRAAQFG